MFKPVERDLIELKVSNIKCHGQRLFRIFRVLFSIDFNNVCWRRTDERSEQGNCDSETSGQFHSAITLFKVIKIAIVKYIRFTIKKWLLSGIKCYVEKYL